jgi:hypothetical protein
MSTSHGALLLARTQYHEALCRQLLGYREGALSIADRANNQSKEISKGIAERIGLPLCERPPSGQAIGAAFSSLTAAYMEQAFSLLHHLRPGNWHYSVSQAGIGIAAFDQYKHLAELDRVLRLHPDLKSALGGDYFITPDIVIARESVSDTEINAQSQVIEPTDDVAQLSPLRTTNNPLQVPALILHASVSCKWTMRSDRAQNTRTEALNLIRNRKGRLPHIVAVTMEPMPSRLASLALGTGDLDCVYHAALHELRATVAALNYEDAREMLDTLVIGNRLRDISDLPLDLAV